MIPTETVQAKSSEALSVVPAPAPAPLVKSEVEPTGYRGAGMTILTKEQSTALAAIFEDKEHDIKTTEAGEVFVGQVHVRRRLNEVVGAGQWALVPVPDNNGRTFVRESPGGDDEKKGSIVCLRARLYISGNFISEAIGEQQIVSSRMTYASACEAAKSDALTRCAKDLSIGWECWDKRWTEAWRNKYCVRVACKDRGEDTKYMWRRKDGSRLKGEMASSRSSAPAGDPSEGVEVINEQQGADLWALATETYGRKEAETAMRALLAKHGFDSFKKVTPAKYAAIIAAIKKDAKE